MRPEAFPRNFRRVSQRVLLVTHHRSFKTRTAPWRVHGIARVLADRGNEVTILCTADHARSGVHEFVEGGIRWVETPDLLWGRQRSGWDPWNGFHRGRWLKGKKFDLIHAFETRPAVIHPLLSHLRAHPTPLVIDWTDWWGRGGLIVENRPAWYRFLFGGLETYYEEHFRSRADATTVIARGLADRAESLGVPPASIFRMPNGCWPDQLTPTDARQHRAEFDLPADDFLVGFTAMDVTIGFDLVLSAFQLAAARSPNLTLVITGRLLPEHTARIAATKLGSRIRFLGLVPVARYPQLLGCLEAFFLPFTDRPANHGRWPGRINDYLCVGRPVITNAVGEMKQLLSTEPVGRLCAENPEAMAEALLELQADKTLCAELGRHARRLAEGPLSWPVLAHQLEAAYEHARRQFARRL